ncbi:TadE family protein [Catenulispora pinisilvae]|uniref:TadE family protein n=1 Tax=Catenulispora pinisilvae TaxID=2705253 RepID=UPI0018914216|nr:TadE family protein [Catenulispora pinisilvae]
MKPGTPRRRPDSGFSTVELAFMAPGLVVMLVIIVGLGIMVDTHGVVNEAARDAARAGSLQGDTSAANPDPALDHTQARQQALAAARADLGTRCSGKQLLDADLITSYVPQGTPPGPGLNGIAYYKVTIKCSADLSLLSLFGASKELTATFIAPVNTFQSNTAVVG